MSAVPNIPQSVQLGHEHMPDVLAHKGVLNAKQSVLHDGHAITNGVANHAASDFKLSDNVIENFRPIKVIVIGAGYSGIYCGIRIPERIRNCELVIYDKNDGIGGTWYENRYPGCACDIPSHSYQYSFNPNPNWSSLYAPASEIQKYLQSTVEKFSVGRFIKLKHEIIDCQYKQNEGKWHVKIRGPDGTVSEDTSDILITARGGLNHIAWPKIDGLRSFGGELMHSAAWNEKYNFENKRIGIIGTGSSAIQIIPNLRKRPGTQLSCFIRGKTWISPPFGQSIQDELGLTSTDMSETQRKRFREDPEYFYNFRRKIEADGNAIHSVTIMGTEMQKDSQRLFEEGMKMRLTKKPEIFDRIKPDFAPGCRRLTPGPGFLEALTEDNVDFVSDSITKIEPTGVRTQDGKLHEIDVLVCATGFHTGAAPPFPVAGTNNQTLAKRWEERAESYLSVATDSFPNFFTMLGPNAAIGSGSLTMMIESMGDYIVKCVRKIQKENIKTMAVKPARVRDFIRYVDAYFKGTVFTDDCNSWYRKGDKIHGLWPGSTLHCIETLRSPRWEDFDYEYLSDGEDETNALSWLGNGWSINQMEDGDTAWYLRPEFQNMPCAPLPEDNELLKIRAFSQ